MTNNREEKSRSLGRRSLSEDSLRSALLDEVAEGVFVWDKNGRCTEVNLTAVVMLGYTREEILGSYFLDFIRKEDVADRILSTSQVLSDGHPLVRMLRKDGTSLPVEMRQRLLPDGSVVAIAADIAQRTKAEDNVHNIGRLYATLSGINHAIVRTRGKQSLFDAICEVAVEKGGFKLAMVGLLDEEKQNISIISWRATDGKQPSYITLDIAGPPLNRGLISGCIRTGRVIASNNVQAFVRTQLPEIGDSIRRFTSAACVPIREKEEVIGVLFLGRSDARVIKHEEKRLLDEIGEDISFAVDAMEIEDQRSRAEKELAESERKFGAIMEQMNDAVIVINQSGIIRFVSQAVGNILGFGPDEVEGKHFAEFIIEDDKEFGFREFAHVMRTCESAKDIQLRLKRKSGSVAYCEVDAAVYRSDSLTGLVGVVRDVSERRMAKEELELVETERKDLERQLLQAQKLESLGTLAGGIAHDFNNLLGIIMGYSMMLGRKRPDDAKLEKGLESIRTAAERGASLVRQLLTIARKAETVFEPVSVNNLMMELTRLLNETFPRTVVIETDLREDVPTVVGDVSQLHQALVNLCINSRDAMPLGGTLSLATSVIDGETVRDKFADAKSSRYVIVQVADTGIGMDEDTKAKIFDPFFTTKMPGKGTGLGLALVYSIVRTHEGFIDVESEKGKGTIIRLFFPVEKSAREDSIAAEDEPVELPGGTENILVIEDEEMLLDIMRSVLIPKGYSVFTARDGQEGIAFYSDHSDEIDLVIVDLGLPKIDGEQVIEKIRAMSPDARIVISSGFVDNETRENLMRSGIGFFIQKPYSLRDVLKTVRAAIDSDK